MIRRRRAQAKSDGSSADLWLVTYSDMVTLLLAFFVLMLSFSTVDVERFQRTILSLQQALGILTGGRTVVSEPEMDMGGLMKDRRHLESVQTQQLLSVKTRIQQLLEGAELDGDVDFSLTERGLALSFADQVLFPSGRADLRPEAREILDVVIPVLEDIPNLLRVEGHTDNVPINTPRFPSNWELSAARATNVLRYFLANGGMRPVRLSAAGYGEYRPVASNETVEGRARNRRVDVVILRLGAEEYEPSNPAAEVRE